MIRYVLSSLNSLFNFFETFHYECNKNVGTGTVADVQQIY